MCTWILPPVISSFSLQLSRGSLGTYLSPFLPLPSSPPWVPLVLVLYDRARPNFDQNGHEWSRQILQLLLFHHLPRLLLLLLVVAWPWRPSWHSFSGWRPTLVLVLTISQMRCVRWTLELVTLPADRLAWLALFFLPLLLQRPQLMRMMMPVMMRMMLALLVMMRCRPLSDLPFVICDKTRE